MKRRNPLVEAHRKRHAPGRGAGFHSGARKERPEPQVVECPVGHLHLDDDDCPYCEEPPDTTE